jgi:hypothetical protein
MRRVYRAPGREVIAVGVSPPSPDLSQPPDLSQEAALAYERAIGARYVDPLDLVWLATGRRLGLRIRRNPAIFSATDGKGLLELGPRDTLDPDDTLAQMLLHEICHWITNGVETFSERDWGFALDAELDWREHACLRLQAALADGHGLRLQLAPTSQFRLYYDHIPADPFAPIEPSEREIRVVALARDAWTRAHGPPWAGPLGAALTATASLRAVLAQFLPDYATDIEGDALPSLWAADSTHGPGDDARVQPAKVDAGPRARD